MPMSDGGDGFLDALLPQGEGHRTDVSVSGPFGDSSTIQIGHEDGEALVESASCAGLAVAGSSDPLRATTRGVGEAITAAIASGARRVVVGIGGTASTDGGTGAARSIGWRFLDEAGKELPEGGGCLEELHTIQHPITARVGEAEVVGLCDVSSPLLGEAGSAIRFGPQKGASPDEIAVLERGLTRMAEVVHRELGIDVDPIPGSGAGGGLGAGLIAFFDARLGSGGLEVARRLDLPARIAEADLVITGEGAFDASSLGDKVPAVVASIARERGKPCFLVAGRVEVDAGQLEQIGFAGHSRAAPSAAGPADPARDLAEATWELLRETGSPDSGSLERPGLI